MYRLSSFLLVVVFLLSSCGDSQVTERFRALPTAIGKVQQLNLIVDEDIWETTFADTFSFYYQGAYLILPQPEPIFDLRVFSVEDILENPVRRELKLFVFAVNLSDEYSQLTQMAINDLGRERINNSLENDDFGVQIIRDKWARGQMVVYLYGRDVQALTAGISRSFDQVSSRIDQFYETTVQAEVYGGGTNRELSNLIRREFGAEIDIPSDWMLAVEEDNFVWLRDERRKASLSMMFHQLDYTDGSQLTPEYLRELRDSITREHISSGKKGTYMEVEDRFIPMFDFQRTINGNFAIELRGIWDMREDFMGGPFKSFLVLNEAENKLLFVDVFAYAPADDKRNYMIRLNHIVKSLDFAVAQ
ncbi:MAG: DUF4837 family protein [Saprospirales bacterium]|nr:MAG: DUF4837 family protein [Saprospirales bacterium]